MLFVNCSEALWLNTIKCSVKSKAPINLSKQTCHKSYVADALEVQTCFVSKLTREI